MVYYKYGNELWRSGDRVKEACARLPAYITTDSHPFICRPFIYSHWTLLYLFTTFKCHNIKKIKTTDVCIILSILIQRVLRSSILALQGFTSILYVRMTPVGWSSKSWEVCFPDLIARGQRSSAIRGT